LDRRRVHARVEFLIKHIIEPTCSGTAITERAAVRGSVGPSPVGSRLLCLSGRGARNLLILNQFAH
jgi:hypothetical protein